MNTNLLRPLAVVAGYAMSAMLFGVKPYDPMTLFITVIVFTLVAATASILPAQRASRVDAAEVLRSE